MGVISSILAGETKTDWDLCLSMSFSILIRPALLLGRFSSSSYSLPPPSSKRRTKVEVFPPYLYQSPHVVGFAVVADFLVAATASVNVAVPPAAFIVAVASVFIVDVVFVLVGAAVLLVAVAVFVVFPPDAVVDAVSPTLFAPGVVVGHSAPHYPLYKHQDHWKPCHSLPLLPPLMLLGEVVAPCS